MTAIDFDYNGIKIKKEKLVNKVEAYIDNIDQFGLVKIAFVQKIMVPIDVSVIEIVEAMELKV